MSNENEIENEIRGEVDELIEEIQVVVGLNFENAIIKEHLEANKYDFLDSVASLINKYKEENRVQGFKSKIKSAKLSTSIGETQINDFNSIKLHESYFNEITLETKNSLFIKNNIFEENKKSEEYKENNKITKAGLAHKQMTYNLDFIKQVRENFRKFTSREYIMKEQSEKSKSTAGNKKKCLKIMSFRFFRKNKDEKEKINFEENNQESPIENRNENNGNSIYDRKDKKNPYKNNKQNKKNQFKVNKNTDIGHMQNSDTQEFKQNTREILITETKLNNQLFRNQNEFKINENKTFLDLNQVAAQNSNLDMKKNMNIYNNDKTNNKNQIFQTGKMYNNNQQYFSNNKSYNDSFNNPSNFSYSYNNYNNNLNNSYNNNYNNVNYYPQSGFNQVSNYGNNNMNLNNRGYNEGNSNSINVNNRSYENSNINGNKNKKNNGNYKKKNYY